MLANATPPTPATQNSRQVREVMAVCAKHGIAIGEPENLASFLRALDQDKHFAMDFWSVVARLSEKPERNADPDWLLATIVEAVTGRCTAEVNATGPSGRLLVVKLAHMLAGEDVQSPIAEWPAAESAQGPVDATDRSAEAAAPITPIAPRTPAPTPSRAARREAEKIAPITNPAWLNDGSLRLVLEPEDGSAAEDGPPITIPLSSYADPESSSSRWGLAAGFVLGLAILGGGWLVLHRSSSAPSGFARVGASIRAGYASASAAWTGSGNQHAATAPAVNSSSAPVPPTDLASLPAGQSNPPANEPSHDAPGGTPARTSARAAAPKVDSSESAGSDRAETENVQAIVPESVMERNLLSSRVPIYPDAARASHAEGVVVMRAVVTANGKVQNLAVVQGDPLLRSSAIEAASSWRYRPYILNGRPVDVSTTISMDFSPKRTAPPSTPIPLQ